MTRSSRTAEPKDLLPRHHQVYVVLRQQITEGLYPADRALPGEMELCQQFGVSRITIRRALERLEQEGLIERHRGRGTFPRRTETEPSPLSASISGVLENLIAMGLKTQVEVLWFGYVAAPPEVARDLGIAPGTTVQKAVRVRSHRGRRFSHLTTFVPEDLGRSYDRHDLTSQPLLLLLERAGAVAARAEQVITAKLATPDVAAALDIRPGEALLCIRRIVRDRQGRAIEAITGLYRPDVYEHRMTYERTKGPGEGIWKLS